MTGWRTTPSGLLVPVEPDPSPVPPEPVQDVVTCRIEMTGQFLLPPWFDWTEGIIAAEGFDDTTADEVP